LQYTSEQPSVSAVALSVGSKERKSSLIASTSTFRPAFACTNKHVLHITVEIFKASNE
jgi:hypothetical protein